MKVVGCKSIESPKKLWVNFIKEIWRMEEENSDKNRYQIKVKNGDGEVHCIFKRIPNLLLKQFFIV